MKKTAVGLSDAEKLRVRELESSELRSHKAVTDFQAQANAQIQRLQEEAGRKTAAVMECLQALAKARGFDPMKTGFDFEKMCFKHK